MIEPLINTYSTFEFIIKNFTFYFGFVPKFNNNPTILFKRGSVNQNEIPDKIRRGGGNDNYFKSYHFMTNHENQCPIVI